MHRANRTSEYLLWIEPVRVDGTDTHRTLSRVAEASALRETGELDRIIAALTANEERRWIDIVELAAEQARIIGTITIVKGMV